MYCTKYIIIFLRYGIRATCITIHTLCNCCFIMLQILQKLISFKSISPCDSGAIDFCAEFFKNLGFECHILQFGEVKNLYARRGSGKSLCFAGHVDVVPPFDGWETDPFELKICCDKAIGRGANDMKGPLAAMMQAILEADCDVPLSIMLTSDEEIMGEHGTNAIVDFLKKSDEQIAGCVLCESCSKDCAGEYIKIGCKGSLSVDVVCRKIQCHVAMARYLGNCVNNLVSFVNDLLQGFDNGNENFEPSSVQLTYLKTPEINSRNVVPNVAMALLNIRFCDLWCCESLESKILYMSKQYSDIAVDFHRGKEPFIGSTKEWTVFLQKSMQNVIHKIPECGTYGGNSDAVFIKDLCPVVEIGSPIANAHMSNEYILISDLEKLKNIYLQIIKDFKEY